MWEIFWFLPPGICTIRQRRFPIFQKVCHQEAWCIPKKGCFCRVFFPRRDNQHAKFVWKHSDQTQTKSISLLILVTYAVLWSLLCSGKRGSKGSCEVKLLALQPQEGPPPLVHPLLTPLPLLVLSVFLAEREHFLATLIWGAERETQRLAPQDGDGQFITSALASGQRWLPRLTQEGMAGEVHISASPLEKADTQGA